jgi:hypothetical protein
MATAAERGFARRDPSQRTLTRLTRLVSAYDKSSSDEADAAVEVAAYGEGDGPGVVSAPTSR